jgi:hypothetical protein
MYPRCGSFIIYARSTRDTREWENTDQHEVRQRTSNPRTLSRSPMARTTVSHISKKASCRKRCIETPSRVRSFGANVSPAQKHVLYNNNGDRHQ